MSHSATLEALDEASLKATLGGAMEVALALAEETGRLGNVPVGAVILDRAGQIVGKGANLRHVLRDPTAHAELIAIREAAQRVDSWRLDDATLVVTLEPCPMCAAAIAQARVSRVVFGAADPAAEHLSEGFVRGESALRSAGVDVVSGVREAACAAVLSGFFERLRSAPHGSGAESG